MLLAPLRNRRDHLAEEISYYAILYFGDDEGAELIENIRLVLSLEFSSRELAIQFEMHDPGLLIVLAEFTKASLSAAEAEKQEYTRALAAVSSAPRLVV